MAIDCDAEMPLSEAIALMEFIHDFRVNEYIEEDHDDPEQVRELQALRTILRHVKNISTADTTGGM